MAAETIRLPQHSRAAAVRVDSFSEDDNGINVVFTTGADVLRCDWLDGTYIERLETGPENVRLDRLNAGAAFLDTHNAYELGAMIGAVKPGSARMEGGEGLCRVLLSRSQRAADTVQDLRDGIIRNISVGYNVYAFTRTEASDGSPAIMVATDWEPVEISAVPVPADPGAQVQAVRAATRSASGVELHPCTITRNLEASMADDNKPDASGDEDKAKKEAADKAAAEKAAAEKKAAEDAMTSDEKAKAAAAKKDGLKEEEVLKVDGNKVVHEDPNKVVDPGDANPVKMSPEELERRLQRAAEAAIDAERVRQSDIRILAKRHGLAQLGDEHCARSTKVQAFKDIILNELAKRSEGGGGPKGAAHVDVESLQKSNNSDREAGAAAARAALGKK